MKKCPAISIIIPIYNCEKYIEECIKSILAQTFNDFEIIIINDGSSDNSLNICDQYATRDERIKVFSQNNKGVSSARNRGIDIAQGEWITFIDADDIVYKNYLSHLYVNVNHNIDFIAAGFEYFTSRDTTTYTTKTNSSYKEVLSKDFGITKMYENHFWQWFICSKLFRKCIITRNNIKFNESFIYGEDRLFIMQYICAINGNISFSDTPIYRYRTHPDSAMGKSDNKFDENFVKGFEITILMYYEIRKIKTTQYNNYLALCDIVYSYRTMQRLVRNQDCEKQINKQIKHIIRNVLPRHKYIIICFLIRITSTFPIFKKQFIKLYNRETCKNTVI